MNKILPGFVICLALFLTACSSNTPGGNSTASNSNTSVQTDSTYEPVETKDPNTKTNKPAFEGQTRIAGVKTSTPYEGKMLSDALKKPWGIATLSDGRFIITEKAGTMRIATPAGEVTEPITGLPPVNASGQGGLLGVTVDPAFAENRMLYWVFSEKTPEGNLTAAAKGKLSADEKRVENATVIYRATTCL